MIDRHLFWMLNLVFVAIFFMIVSTSHWLTGLMYLLCTAPGMLLAWGGFVIHERRAGNPVWFNLYFAVLLIAFGSFCAYMVFLIANSR